MILTGKVIDIHHASQFTDNIERVTIRFADADPMFNSIRLPNKDFPNNLVLGEEIAFAFDNRLIDRGGLAKSMPQLAKEIADRGQAGRFTSGQGV